MTKKPKVRTPTWILEGYNSLKDYEKSRGIKIKKKEEKIFKIRKCPKCDSDNLKVLVGEVGIWTCEKCNWKGKEIKKEELTEEEFMKYLDEKGEDVA